MPLSDSTDRFFGVIASLAIKAPCKAVATGNITLSGSQTVDGFSIGDDDRVLCIGQTDAKENGIYVADGSSAWQRAADFDGNRDIVKGTLATVDHSSGFFRQYQVTTANPITIGTTNINFILFFNSGASTDDDAIHDNVAAEISAITEKVTPVSADLVVIEDSAAANVKKKVQIGNFPGVLADGTEIDTMLRWDGASAWVESTGVFADGTASLEVADASNGGLRIDVNASGTVQFIQTDGAHADEDIWVNFQQNAGLDLYHNNLIRYSSSTTGINVHRTLNIDTEGNRVHFTHQNGLIRGFIGFDNGSSLFRIENEIHGAPIVISAENAAGAARNLLNGDPDTDVKLYHPATGAEVARTISAATGGLEVDNDATGPAGFERVLTVADLGGIGAVAQTLTATWATTSSYNQTNVSGTTFIRESGAVDRFEDNAELRFGTGDDIRVDFDGTDWVIAGTGNANFNGFTDFNFAGRVVPNALTVPNEVVITTNVITAAESGKTFFLDLVDGFTSTLPVPAAGLKYRFIVKTAPTTAYIITTNADADILFGTVNEITTTAGISVQAQDTLNFVASTSLIGDWIEFESDGTNWYVHGVTQVDNGITASVT